MDVLEELSKKLKSTWDNDEKSRKIYIELCKLFSYDPRLQFLEELGPKGKNLKKEIINQEVDIKNVTDFNVSCGTFSKYLKQARIELLGESSIIEGNGHRFLLFDSCRSYGQIKADATLGDLTRAKLGAETKGYKYLDVKKKFADDDFELNLMQTMDTKIEYILYFYNSLILMLLDGPSLSGSILEQDFIGEEERDKFIFNYLLSQVKYEEESYQRILETFDASSTFYLDILKKYFASSIINKMLDSEEAFQYKICIKIKELFNENYRFTNFVDAVYVLNYLFLIAFNGKATSINLVSKTNDIWDYITVIKLAFDKMNIFLLLEPDEIGIYHLKFKKEQEIKTIIKEYKGNNKNLILR